MPTKTRKYDLHYRDLEGDIEAEVVIIGGLYQHVAGPARVQ
ncbi:hypothetical protein SAMN03159391_03321 [Pseudomonas sp. NFACC37-1]|nr:hypothetical protein SAMN03159391_03321 [Pseudomonas sp. NFACC37-1]